MAHEQPCEQRHRKRLDRPVDEQRDTDAARVGSNPMQRAEVDADQHRHDHQPDQEANRHIHARDFEPRQHSEWRRRQLPESDAGDDAQRDPQREPALEPPQCRWQGRRDGDSGH
jgi:hypothetical protein